MKRPLPRSAEQGAEALEEWVVFPPNAQVSEVPHYFNDLDKRLRDLDILVTKMRSELREKGLLE